MTAQASKSVTFTTATMAVCAHRDARRPEHRSDLLSGILCKINEYGFVEAPYRKVKKTYDENGRLIDQVVTDEVEYMTADVEDEYVVAQANEPLDEGKHFIRPRVSARRRDDILEIDARRSITWTSRPV